MAKRDREKILTLMNIWEMNAGNYEIMEKALPSDPQSYRFFAKFLGEKSLSLEERQKFLARAELAEFERARRENQLAETDLFYIRFQEAQYHFQTAVDLLKGIQFYQTLTGQNLIRTADFTEALKSALLNLAKCRIQQREGLSEVEDLLRLYLSLEDKPKEVGDLEAYLRDRGVLAQRFEKSFDDLGHFAFELLLYFKQNRYREIIEIGRRLEQSFIVVPEAKKKDYVRILLLVGDSFQKVDLLYDAGDIYQKALEIDPNNLGTLLKIRQNYERLNEAKKLEEINKAIEKLMTPREIGFRDLLLNKGEILSRSLIFDGQKVVLDVQLQINEKSGAPLIAVFFNNRVVWEEYLKNGAVSLSLETKAGENALQIMPVNRPVSLAKLTYRLSNENKNLPTLRR
jgi:tetratricopeptide (TPR) repeat protein